MDKTDGKPIGGRDRSLDEPIRRPTEAEIKEALGQKNER